MANSDISSLSRSGRFLGVLRGLMIASKIVARYHGNQSPAWREIVALVGELKEESFDEQTQKMAEDASR